MGINFQDVVFRHLYNREKRNLNNVTFNIEEKNEFIFILGHTGSGKTTLVQNMNALLLPEKGRITLFGQEVITKYKTKLIFNTKKSRLRYLAKDNHKLFTKAKIAVYNKHLRLFRKRVGLVFQFPEYQLFESTVIKDVMFGPLNYGLNETEAKHLSIEALRLVGLNESIYEKSPFSLSGGQMRRVAIAGILAMNPDIIVLDEPTVGLDPLGKIELMELLKDIQSKTNKSIILISHDMNIVSTYAKRVMVMSGGVLEYDGDPRTLFENVEQLLKYNLELPTIAIIALKLKEKGLINYQHLPLTKEELKKVILRGSNNE